MVPCAAVGLRSALASLHGVEEKVFQALIIRSGREDNCYWLPKYVGNKPTLSI